MKLWMIAIGLALVAIAPVAYLVYHFRFGGDSVAQHTVDTSIIDFRVQKNTTLEPGNEIEVLECKVQDGYMFSLHLAGDQWIEAHLPVATKEEAKKIVTNWLQKASPPPPTVVLKRNVGSYWIVDFHITIDGSRRSAVGMLGEKGLLLN
jgi:hypothetical protein